MAVSVDDDFVRFGAKSYAINKITSVEVRESRPHAMGCAVALGLLAGAAAVFWLASFGEPGGAATIFLAGAIILAGAAYWQRRRAMIAEYQLFLITSAAETQAFVSRDAAEVDSLRTRIERAMTVSARSGR